MHLSFSRPRLTFASWDDIRLQAAPAMPYILAIVVGAGAGVAAIGFAELISACDWLFFDQFTDSLGGLGDWRYVFAPVIGGLLVGPIVYMFASEARGHGVPEVMMAVETQSGRIRHRVAFAKSVASAITIGSGGSAGREGPVVQIASSVGSTIGQVFRLSDENIRVLVAAGAAGGISAIFNAPIAGVFFALEVILRHFNVRNFGIVVLSSVVASAVSHAYFGDDPAFRIPEYRLESAAEFPLYALLGIVSAVAALAFVWLLYRSEEFFDGARVPGWVKPALGGLGVGLIGIWYTDVFGSGYGSGPGSASIPLALTGQRGADILILLGGLKLVATSLTLGSGGSGGVFAPSLFIGAMVGGAFGRVVGEVFPGVTAPSGAYATVGMAAVFAGAARAPMTAITILFEMTRDYSIILPLMAAVVVSTVVAQVVTKDSIYTIKLRLKGINIDERRSDPLLASIPVAQAMNRVFEAVRADMRASDLLQAYSNGAWHEEALPVVQDDRHLAGIITGGDLQRALERDLDGLTALDVASRNVVTVHPDQPLDEAMRLMGVNGLRQLPVISRGKNPVLLGVLRRSDVFGAYGKATAGAVRQVRPSPLAGLSAYGTQVIDAEVAEDSPAAGKTIAELHLPEESVVVSIIRQGAAIIPRGNVVVNVGDRIIAVTTPQARAEARKQLLP